jgi:hypothetical protein
MVLWLTLKRRARSACDASPSVRAFSASRSPAVDLFLLIGDLLIGDADPDVLRQDLLVDALDFVAGGIRLQDAVLKLAQEACFAASVG